MKFNDLIEDYWERRMRNPRMGCIIINICNLVFQVQSIANPLTWEHYIVSWAFTINSILILLATLPSYWNKSYNKFVRYGFMLVSARQVIYLFNLSNQKDTMDFQMWIMFCMCQIIASSFCICFFLQYFDNRQAGHLTFSIAYMMALIVGVIVCVFGYDNFFSGDKTVSLLILSLTAAFCIILMIRSESRHQE